jgi:glyoxylase-like metal-dependent hydrolase (beta-lactamase superfamily II)
MTEPAYELFAIRYATREARRSDHFIGGDPHDGPMPMDYFMWLAKGEGRSFVIDTGFREEVAERRKRTFLRCPVEALALFDVDPNAVEDVILTHLHYDHVGNFDRFPRARFHLQERELAYAIGKYMRYRAASSSMTAMQSSLPASPFTRRAAIRPACNSFASGRPADLSCSPPTSAISTRTWRASARSRRRSTLAR